MKINEIIEVTIESCGMEGEGVARLNGEVVFINGALIGEKIRAQVTEVKKNFSRAKVIKVLEASSHRIQPLCPIFFRCGGCDMQHVDYIPEERACSQTAASNPIPQLTSNILTLETLSL